LPRCLESVQGLFDEIIVVDTGSVDRTKDIAAQYGAQIVEICWADDFSAARNASLEAATGDYAFWLDADDILEASERIKLEKLIASLQVGQRNAFVMPTLSDRDPGRSGVIITDHVRLFPLSEEIRWQYRVHEQILMPLKQAGVVAKRADICIRHTGYSNPETKERKRQRDWKILQQELLSKPNDSFVLFNLGVIFFERKSFQEALEYFSLSFVNIQDPGSGGSLHRKLLGMLAWMLQLLGNLHASLRICNEGLALDPQDAELLFRKAIALRYLRRTNEAEKCWRAILQLKGHAMYSSVDKGILGHLTRRNLAHIAAEKGDKNEMRIQWLAVLAECPGDPDATRHLASLAS